MSPKPFASSSFTGYEHYANDTIPFFRGDPPSLKCTPSASTNTVPKKNSETALKTAQSISVSNKKIATKPTKKENEQPIRRKPRSPTIRFPWSSRYSPARVPQQSTKTSTRSPVSKVPSSDTKCGEYEKINTLNKRVIDFPFGAGSKSSTTLETSFTIKEGAYQPTKQQSPTSSALRSPRRVRRASTAVSPGSTSIMPTSRVIAKHRSYSLAEGMKLPHRVRWGSPEFPFIKPQRLQKVKTKVYAAPIESGQPAPIKESSHQPRRAPTSSLLASPTRPRLGLGQNDGSAGSGGSPCKQKGPLQSINSSLIHASMPIRKPIQTSPSRTGGAPSGGALSLEQKFISLKPQRDPPTPTSPSPSPPKKSKGNAENSAKAIQIVRDPGKAITPLTKSNVLSLFAPQPFLPRSILQ